MNIKEEVLKRIKSKYGARKVHRDGVVYDSRSEARRGAELALLQRAGEIRNLRRQVPYELIPVQREQDTVGARGAVHKGHVIEKAVYYVADFVYDEKTADGWQEVVEDVNGFKTHDYIIKRKVMMWRYGIRIREVKA